MIGIFLDIETTGLDPLKHRVIEIAFRLINLYDGAEVSFYKSIVYQSEPVWKQSDPRSLQINGFNPSKVECGKTEDSVRSDIKKIFKDYDLQRGKAVFICQNPSFDRSFFSQIVSTYDQEILTWPYHWLDFASMFWALKIEKSKNQSTPLDFENINLSKDKIAEKHKLPKEAKPHRAMNGVDHLVLCYATVIGFPKSISYDHKL